jgi:transposase
MKTTTIGIDLAKTVFQIHGMDDHVKPVLRKKLDRSKMLEFFFKLSPV